MNAKILGYRYKFIIELEKNDKNFSFQKLSSYNRTQQKSIITNLNFIISELISPIIGTIDVDTTIFLDEREGVELFQESTSTFKDKPWNKILEKALDEDRNIGGWNSNFKI